MIEHPAQDLIDAIADDWMADIIIAYDQRYEILEHIFAVDGKVWPALVFLGSNNTREYLVMSGFSESLADACIAAAEVEP